MQSAVNAFGVSIQCTNLNAVQEHVRSHLHVTAAVAGLERTYTQQLPRHALPQDSPVLAHEIIQGPLVRIAVVVSILIALLHLHAYWRTCNKSYTSTA